MHELQSTLENRGDVRIPFEHGASCGCPRFRHVRRRNDEAAVDLDRLSRHFVAVDCLSESANSLTTRLRCLPSSGLACRVVKFSAAQGRATEASVDAAFAERSLLT